MIGGLLVPAVLSLIRSNMARAQPAADLETLLMQVQEDPRLAAQMRLDRDHAVQEGVTRKVAPHIAPSGVPISQFAKQMIIACEVSGERVYESQYEVPTKPGGQSGVTIGIGYDIGWVSRAQFLRDWADVAIARAADFEQLATAVGIHDARAEAIKNRLQGIRINYADAVRQFNSVELPLYVSQTLSALPNLSSLPGGSRQDCIGALVSLVYNRGASFRLTGPRYLEMRDIRSSVLGGRFEAIPAALRSMKRIWQDDPSVRGVAIRREMEAQLFEKGLRAGSAA